MKKLSRHLPPASPMETSTLNKVCNWAILTAFCAGVGYLAVRAIQAILHYPTISVGLIMAAILTLVPALFIVVHRENKQIEKNRQERAGENICSFRRAFDVRKVDPWIIRATYEEFRDSLGIDYPIRADDQLDEDLRIDDEDFDEACTTIAARAGYDLEHTEQNPYYGKVNTVRDFVMFLTHQPCIRKSG